MAGARLGYAFIYHTRYFTEHPERIYRFWEGGMSFHGGFVGIMAAAALFGLMTRKRFYEVTDFIAPLAPLGLMAGRIGNFINGELWGRPSEVPWAIIFPGRFAGRVPRHPSQLYEAFFEGLLLFVILWFFTRKQRPYRAVSGLFLVLYGGFRFFIEFYREPDRQLGFIVFDWLTMGQLLCLPLILWGAALLYLVYRASGGRRVVRMETGPQTYR
jgi:phosphatidylglycerol:prolipoprotein diacylglycerol transferase